MTTPVDLPAACRYNTEDVRPLHYWRIAETEQLYYGRQSYITHNAHYGISREAKGWIAERLFAPFPRAEKVEQAGLLTATFARRKDAVSALEAVLEEL